MVSKEVELLPPVLLCHRWSFRTALPLKPDRHRGRRTKLRSRGVLRIWKQRGLWTLDDHSWMILVLLYVSRTNWWTLNDLLLFFSSQLLSVWSLFISSGLFCFSTDFQDCLLDVRNWMCESFLQLDGTKTEVLLTGSFSRLPEVCYKELRHLVWQAELWTSSHKTYTVLFLWS